MGIVFKKIGKIVTHPRSQIVKELSLSLSSTMNKKVRNRQQQALNSSSSSKNEWKKIK
jgi:hypothetical protein